MVLLYGVQSSRLTWWRLKLDLLDLGWQVYTIDMLGHGSRHAAGPGELIIDDLAQDVSHRYQGL
jgi:pimeloyl-ACP methyl ester carboxylesterase